MASGGDEITIGYWYRMGAHLALAHTVHAYLRIRAGDKNAWTAPDDGITTTTQIYIDKPNLFGGEQREGGIQGYVDLVIGNGFEQPNSYLQSRLPSMIEGVTGVIPAFRGVSGMVLRRPRVAANNPNLRPWNAELFYQPSADWYPETERFYPPGMSKLIDVLGVNPAHIVRECLINPHWGLGYSQLELDDASFRAAALTLYNEDFPLNLVWDHEASLLDFISTVIAHISGALYVNPATGLFTLKLFRADYDVNTLPIFDDSNIVEVTQYERLSTAELINQVVVLWYDITTDQQRSVTVHNTVVRELQGGVVSTTIELPGISNPDLASRVATSQLARLSTAFSRISFRANREAATLNVGDVFKLTWPDYGLSGVVYRVGRIGYPAADSTEIVIDAIEDMFSFGVGLYSPPLDSGWVDPISPPAPAPYHMATEAPYILVERAARESQALIGDIDPMAGFLTYQASSPAQDAFSYSLYTRTGANAFVLRSVANFCPIAATTAPVGQEVTTTVSISPFTNTDISVVRLNTYAYLGNELVEITALSDTSATLKRGVLDTVPVKHLAGEMLWFCERFQGQDRTEWLDGVTVDAKASVLTGKGPLALDATPTDSLLIKRRWYRPYPPGNLQVNGVRWPTTAIVGEIVLTWSHRDRTTQLSYYVSQSEGDFGPEAGVTYTVRVYDRNKVLKRTVTGLTGTTWTYASADEIADAPGTVFVIMVTAVRGGLESWQAQQATIIREGGFGWGYNWGNFWGGFDPNL